MMLSNSASVFIKNAKHLASRFDVDFVFVDRHVCKLRLRDTSIARFTGFV